MLKTVSSITNAIGALNYKGTWDASTNTPALASGVGTKGDYYVVSVAGSTNLNGITTWYVGDWAAFNGTVWQRLEGGVDDPAPSLKSNSTTGLMQITGPAAGQTRVMTIPDANFTAARTDAAQTFSGTQSFSTSQDLGSFPGGRLQCYTGNSAGYFTYLFDSGSGTDIMSIAHNYQRTSVSSGTYVVGGWGAAELCWETNSGLAIRSATSGNQPADRLYIEQGGTTRPGANNAYSFGNTTYKWTEIWAVNGTIQTSDERQKDNIQACDLGLSFINQLQPSSYRWKVRKNEVSMVEDGTVEIEVPKETVNQDGSVTVEIVKQTVPSFKEVLTPIAGVRTHYGLRAQQVKQVLNGKDFGGFIEDAESGEMGLRYEEFIAPMIKAIQELSAEVEQLKQKLAAA